MHFFWPKISFFRKYVYICSPKPRGFRLRETSGEMPEWSIGPHSKCGVRATVPGVRIPLSPQGTLRKVAKNPVNHAFTGFLFLAKVLKKASESRLSVAYSVYFFFGPKKYTELLVTDWFALICSGLPLDLRHLGN